MAPGPQRGGNYFCWAEAAFVGKLVFKLSFEEWAGFGYLVMGNGTPGRMHCASKTKER